jgi:tetratricopeptide (TPR) repeat protein
MRKAITSCKQSHRLGKLATEMLLVSASAAVLYLLPAAVALVDDSMLSTSVQAAEERRPPPSTRQSETLTRRVYERIEEVMALREVEDYAGARKILDEIRAMNDRGQLNNREQFTMWQFYASLDQGEENYRGAVENYRKVLDVPELPPDMLSQTWMMVGSLLYAVEEYQEAIDAFITYNSIALEPNADVYLRMATAYYQLEQYQTALDPLRQNMELVRASGREIPQSTYSLLRALYIILEDFPSARQTVREMIVLYNEADDWGYLATIEAQLENFQAQAHTLYVADAGGYLDTENQLLNLATQLYNNDNPYGCAEVFVKGFESEVIKEDEDNLAFTATCYQIAREDAKAVPYLERAAEMSDEGELYARLGRVLMTLNEFERATEAFVEALRKGEVNRPDQLYLQQARAYMELNRYDEGIQAARNAGRDERSSDTARTWVTVLTSEKERYEYVQQVRRDLAQYFRAP